MRIGMIGLGNMGAGMARNIRAARFELTVYDVREEAVAALERAGASRGHSPADVAAVVDVVLTSLPGPDQVASVTVNPDFDFPVGDVAILKLTTPVTGVAPTLIDVGRAPASGDAGVIVGFGRSGGLNFDYGIKRRGAVTIEPCSGDISNATSVCWTFDEFVGPPGDDSNTCNGDSGGALFSDFGCAACSSFDR